MTTSTYPLYSGDTKAVIKKLGKKGLIEALKKMLMIRNFEIRAEAAYQSGKIGGFFHAYIGQEAIQTAALTVLGPNHWFTTSYRCHAMALLLGEHPNHLMAELFGKSTGNAKGRGGSMHLYSNRMLGGFGIVGGQTPIAAGAAFASKYLGKKDEIAICFLGDGAMPQGAFHESMNLVSLWNLPCLYVVENNQWSMGTHLTRGVSNPHNFSQDFAKAYGIESLRFDGMDFINCYSGFEHILNYMKETGRPFLVECITERFRGHSISDPGQYRSKDELKKCMEKDPIFLLKNILIENKMLTEEEFKAMDKIEREKIIEAVQFADESPWPDVATLEQDVFAP